MNRRDQLALLGALFLIVLATARLCHALVLLDYPITDDEYAARFAGQVLAKGHFRVLRPEPYAAFPNFQFISKDGWVACKDWLGAQLGAGFAEITGLGPLFYAFIAAIPALFVALIIRLRQSFGYALLGFVLIAVSPMAFALSMTIHSQLLSRAFLAITLLLYLIAEERKKLPFWILTGLAAGIGFICRPFETFFLLLPLVLFVVVRSLKAKERRWVPVAGLFIGAMGPLAAFAFHNWLLQGNPFLPAYFANSNPVDMIVGAPSLLRRLGSNTGYNLLMLAIWFLGPLGIILVSLGVMTNRFTRLLGVGVGSVLVAGLLHDNYGIHAVGPIHYSECVVPLTILAIYGLANLRSLLRRKEISSMIPGSILACVVLLSIPTFDYWHTRALNKQTEIQSYIYHFIDDTLAERNIRKAVVLAPQFAKLWLQNDYFRSLGSWVFEWRRFLPDLSDPILILHDIPGLDVTLKNKFPDRPFFRVRNTGQPPFFELIPAEIAQSPTTNKKRP